MNPMVTIAQVNPAGPSVTALLGDGVAKPTTGGGWAVVPRPKWVGFTEWEGVDPYRMTIPLVFDGFAEDRSVELDIETLRQMMRPLDTPRTRPPIVRLIGPIPLSHLNWGIQNIDYGDELRRSDGQRVRAFFTLEVIEWIQADVLFGMRRSPAVAAAEAAPTNPDTPAAAPASGKTYTVKRGDTLSAIAARQLGNSNRWREIADMNGIRDPRTLKVGQVLRLP